MPWGISRLFRRTPIVDADGPWRTSVVLDRPSEPSVAAAPPARVGSLFAPGTVTPPPIKSSMWAKLEGDPGAESIRAQWMARWDEF